jgi:hypothetical protein
MTRINNKNGNLNKEAESFDSLEALTLNSYRKISLFIIEIDSKSDEDSKNMLVSFLAQLVRSQSVKNPSREPNWHPRSAIG